MPGLGTGGSIGGVKSCPERLKVGPELGRDEMELSAKAAEHLVDVGTGWEGNGLRKGAGRRRDMQVIPEKVKEADHDRVAAPALRNELRRGPRGEEEVDEEDAPGPHIQPERDCGNTERGVLARAGNGEGCSRMEGLEREFVRVAE